MEAVAFVIIGGALFSHAWYLLRLYPDGRTMGIFVGALGLAVLFTLTLDPMLLTGIGDDGTPLKDANPLAEVTVMKMVILLWAGYAIGVAAQALWEFDERAIGFYSAVLAAASAVAFFYFSSTLFDPYGNAVLISLSAATLVLSFLAGMAFFFYAIPFAVLQPVTGWFLLIGGIAVSGIGLAIVSTLIQARG